MGQKYGQLSLEERCEIARLHAAGFSRRAIAEALGRNPAARTCELLGIVPVIKRGPVFQEPARPRPIAELMARHARMIDLLRTFEHRNHLLTIRRDKGDVSIRADLRSTHFQHLKTTAPRSHLRERTATPTHHATSRNLFQLPDPAVAPSKKQA